MQVTSKSTARTIGRNQSAEGNWLGQMAMSKARGCRIDTQKEQVQP